MSDYLGRNKSWLAALTANVESAVVAPCRPVPGSFIAAFKLASGPANVGAAI